MTVDFDDLHRAATARRLLVVSDYDGVIAPIVSQPAEARPDPLVRDALIRLSAMPSTDVFLLSGRSLDSLRALFDPPESIALIGSHGAEGLEPLDLSPEHEDRLRSATEELRRIEDDFAGSSVEEKPTSVAFHVRNVAEADRGDALERVRTGPSSAPGIVSVEGKQVIELLVTDANKGTAIGRVRAERQPDCTVFLGDDVTDEHAFEKLDAGDLGVKVGSGPTAAGYRVESQTDVGPFLARLADERAAGGPGEDE